VLLSFSNIGEGFRANPLRAAPGFAAALLAVAYAAVAPAAGAPEALRLSVPEGRVLNEFYRNGPVAAHLVLTGGQVPRIVIAFPAGNSGAAVWLASRSDAFSWQPQVSLDAAHRRLADGSLLHGVTAELVATGGPVTVTQAITGSIRSIRDYQDTRHAPSEVVVAPQVSDRSLIWERRRLDGAGGYFLSIEVLRGAIAGGERGPIELNPDPGGRLHLRLTALTGDPPLTPLAEDALLSTDAASDSRLRRMLAFLSYQEKLLAGSWRFNTYFGRDTLMSLELLSPVLRPGAFEAGLGAVLERLNDTGEVAHEEDIGEYAVLQRLRQGLKRSAEPLYDYRMIDDDFMLAVVAARYLLDTPDGRHRAAAFLDRRTASGETYGAVLLRNFRFVLATAAPFARNPQWRQLVALKPGQRAGNWRDSELGLGGGRYPYDVNGALVPAALEAIARFRECGSLRRYLDRDAEGELSHAAAFAEVWRREAPHFFTVEVPQTKARAEVESYARSVGVDPSAALAALGAGGVRFHAVALDEQGRPIPVLNSDEGVALLLLTPPSAEVERAAVALARPFPAGLLTDVGLVVANPAYATDELEPSFDRSRYHGTVVWAWQQALFAAAIERQLGRSELTASARAALMRTRSRLRAASDAAESQRGSELWSWSQANGRYRLEPFGQRVGDETESNAAQLWSTVQLARPEG
jgi:hypothetical protein